MSDPTTNFYEAYEALVRAANEVSLSLYVHDEIRNLGRAIAYPGWAFERDHPEEAAERKRLNDYLAQTLGSGS